MRPFKISTVKSLLLAGVGEVAMHSAFGMCATTALTGLGLSVYAAVPAAIVIWNVGERHAVNGLRHASNALGHGLGLATGKAVDGVQDGFRAFRMMLAGQGNAPGALPDRAQVPLVHGGNPEVLGAALRDAGGQARPVMVDTLLTEDGYKAFMASAKATRIPVIDLDSLDEQKAARSQRGYTSAAHAVGDLTKRTEKGPLSPDDVAQILQRTASSEIAPDQKRAIYGVLDAELIEARAEIGAAREARNLYSAKADEAVQEMDNASLQRLQDNEGVREAFEGMGLVREPDRFFQALQRNVAQEGVEATLNKLRDNPAQFTGDVAPQGTTPRPGWLTGFKGEPDLGPAIARDGAGLAREPEVLAGLRIYVENVGAVKESAAAVLALRERQQALEAALAEREAALETVETRIKRETALLDPQTQRQILRDSLQAILQSRQSEEPKLVQTGMNTAHAEEREADVRTMHEVRDGVAAIERGEAPADLRAHTQSAIVVQSFNALTTQAVGRFYEANPEQDPNGTMAKAGRAAQKQLGIDPEADRLGDAIALDGFGARDDGDEPKKGRSIRTRSRRAKTTDHGIGA